MHWIFWSKVNTHEQARRAMGRWLETVQALLLTCFMTSGKPLIRLSKTQFPHLY